jgi:glutaminase
MMLSNFVLNNDDSSVFAGNAFAKQASGATKQIFMALDLHRKGAVSSKFFTAFLARNGLLRGDSRLTTMFTYFDSLGKGDQDLSLMDFDKAISDCRSLIHKCVSGALRLPDFELLTEVVDTIFDEVEPDRSGDNAQYIPQLAEVNPEQFSVCLTSVDGQQYARGDSDEQFCIQSCSKPISYLIGVNQFGQTYVHNHVGTEPSGHRFDEMVLKNAPLEGQPNRQIPHNPMINAGAIMTVSMVHPEIMNRSERLAKVLDVWRRLSAGAQGDPIGYSEETYVSESGTADRNWCAAPFARVLHACPRPYFLLGRARPCSAAPCRPSRPQPTSAGLSWPLLAALASPANNFRLLPRGRCLAYMMKERGAYPPCFSNLSETLELYFQICSILSTNRAMSIMAATLANGGVNPRTGQRVFSPDDVRSVLPLMLTAGMYDYSGQWVRGALRPPYVPPPPASPP